MTKRFACKSNLRRIISLAFVSWSLLSAPAFALTNITIMADNGASLAIARLAREYARMSGVAVATSFIDRQAQAAQILEGGAADILITTDAKWINDLQTQGLVDIYSKVEFARGKMALVGPKDVKLNFKLTDNFISAPLVQAMNLEPGLYVGNPEYVAEGKYARECLRSMDALDVLEPYTLYLKSTDEMIEQVTQRHGFAVMNYGQALLLENSQIIDVCPEKSHSAMPYYAVVIAGDNMNEARKFTKFLTSAAAQNTINASGLTASVPAVQNPANR